MSEVAAEQPKPKTPRPMLVSGTLLVAVVAEPPMGKDADGKPVALTPFGTYAATVAPFNRKEAIAYFEALKPFRDAAGKLVDEVGLADKQAELLATRIKKWDAELVEGTVAEINKGTVALLPDFAFEEFLSAALGGAGVILGN